MESAEYTIEEAVQAIQELDFGENTCSINRYIQKRRQNNDMSKAINMERPDITPAVYSLLQSSQPITTVPEKSLERFFEKPTKRKNDTFLCFSFIERNNTGNKHHAPPTWSKLQQLP